MILEQYAGWRRHGVQFRHILLATAAVYAAWTPIYLLSKPAPIATPDGEHVQLVVPMGTNSDSGRSVEHQFAIRQEGAKAPATILLYEGLTPLPADHYRFASFNTGNPWRVVFFTASDGSDPRHNGRSYYAVVPRDGQGVAQAGGARTALAD